MNTAPLRLLVVEDHKALAENLFEFFGASPRYMLDYAADGLTALHLLASQSYDVVILDVMLPGVSGFEICRRLRHDLGSATPVIMMTAKDQLADKEQGFGCGADDYLVKPFDLKELQLRVDALARRRGAEHTSQIQIPGLSYDLGRLRVHIPGHVPLDLSGTSARIFELLVKAYPDFVSYERLSEVVWADRDVDRNTLRTHAYGLRKTLQDHFGLTLIKTLHGRGYCLLSPQESGE